jgi:hypothetical protein
MSRHFAEMPSSSASRWQKQLNSAFPRNARSIPDQPRDIEVWVRIVWEHDGEMSHMGRATCWTDRVVFVEFGDERLATIGVWVKPGDVRRQLLVIDPYQYRWL